MPDDQHPMNDCPHLDRRLKEFIERVIVPILVKEYLAQSQEPEMRKVPMTEQRDFSSKTSGTQIEAKFKELSSKDLLTVAEAAAVLRIKEATVRAWILKRKITYVKLGGVVRIPAKELKLLIQRSTVPSR